MLQKRSVTIQCPICAIIFDPSLTQTSICTQCLVTQEDITTGISRNEIIQFCQYCRRYNRPPWVLCERESKELLSICLKKITGLNQVKLIQAIFVFTEPTSKQIKVRVTVQKEIMNQACLQQNVEVLFQEEWKQCIDCRKEFTPHTWGASIQLRQRVDNKKTFHFLEQLIIKNHMEDKLLKIESVEGGLDLFYKTQQQAKQMLEFLQQVLPVKIKHSTELISQDFKSNTMHTKHSYSVEVPRICKDNLCVLPAKLAQQMGGIGRLQICHKISSIINLIDPMTLKCSELSSEKYFQYDVEIEVFDLKRDGSEFTILDIEMIQNSNVNESFLSSITNNYITRLARVEIMQDAGNDFKVHNVKTHLGAILRVGQTVIGFDLTNVNNGLSEVSKKPDVILIQIKREKKTKKLNLKRLQIIQTQDEGKKNKPKQATKNQNRDDDAYDEFLEDLENDPDMQKQILFAEETTKLQDGPIKAESDIKTEADSKTESDIQTE